MNALIVLAYKGLINLYYIALFLAYSLYILRVFNIG